MHVALNLAGILIRMTRQAKLVRNGCDQLYAGDIFRDPNFMTGETAHRHRGVDRFAFAFFFMALGALAGVRLRVERNGMNARRGLGNYEHQQHEQLNNGPHDRLLPSVLKAYVPNWASSLNAPILELMILRWKVQLPNRSSKL